MDKNFYKIVKDFNCLLVDSYGVVTFNGGIKKEAVDVLEELKSMGKTIIMLSNATFMDPEERYAQKGLFKDVHYDAFVTAGQYAREDVKRGLLPCGRKYTVFGTANFKMSEKEPALFWNSMYKLVEDPQEADFVYCGIPQINGEDRETIDDFLLEIRNFAALGLPMVCSNPDEIASEDGRWVIRQGTIVKVYREMGGKVILYGKPDSAIFDYVLGEIPREEVLMIGDTLGTDILGANRAGVKSCLTIFGGVTEMRMIEKGISVDRGSIEAFIKEVGSGVPDFIVDKIF